MQIRALTLIFRLKNLVIGNSDMLDMVVLFENLSELASKELQEQLWLYGNEGQMSSFTESICGVFDDAKLTRALETGYIEKKFSSNLCKKVKQLDQAINLVPEDLPPAEIILSLIHI